MKPMINDQVGVCKVTACGRVIEFQAKLVKEGFGRKTEDKRALAEPGEVTKDNEVAAAGWRIVEMPDGKQISASTKLVKLYNQALVKESNDTLAALAAAEKSGEATKTQVAEAKKFAESKGLDVKTLTDANLLKIRTILQAQASA